MTCQVDEDRQLATSYIDAVFQMLKSHWTIYSKKDLAHLLPIITGHTVHVTKSQALPRIFLDGGEGLRTSYML